jgi:hypothetical protein
VPPSRRECVGTGAGQTLLFGRSSGMCHEEHVHPLVQAFQAEGLVIQLVPNFKDKIEVSPVSYRGLLLTGVLVRILRSVSLPTPCLLLHVGGLDGSPTKKHAG